MDLVVADIGGSLFSIRRHLVAELLGAAAFQETAQFTSTGWLVSAGGIAGYAYWTRFFCCQMPCAFTMRSSPGHITDICAAVRRKRIATGSVLMCVSTAEESSTFNLTELNLSPNK